MRSFFLAAFLVFSVIPAVHAQMGEISAFAFVPGILDSTTARVDSTAERALIQDRIPIASTLPNTIKLDVDFHLNSNAMMTTFAGAFLTQNNITSSMINRVLSYTKKDIKYEDELKAGLAYEHYFKKPGVTLYASYYTRNLRNLTTSHDAFQLIFEGNAPFENKTASLNDLSFLDLMYNQYSVGISKTDGHFFAGINVSYLQGYNNQQLRNPTGSLYTAPYGQYLDLAYDMTFNEAGTGATHFFQALGQGVSADIRLGYATELSNFTLTVKDLGYISWGKHPLNYTGDTSFTFNGIVINDLTNISGSGANGLNLDSAFSVLEPKKSEKTYKTLLPTTIEATYSHVFKRTKHGIILTASVNTRFMYHYYAYGYVKSTFMIGHDWATSVSAGAGGYSLFNLGWDIGKRWRNLDFLIGTNNLIGSIVPMYYPGSSFYLRIAAHF